MEQVAEALLTGAGLLWMTLWALILGYTISAGIQVLITREQMARLLGERGPKKGALASFFGFVSSSCSFAALAASRSVLVKGAHPANAVAFLIASTNLVIELGLVLLILLGWHFFVGNILLGILMIVYAYALTRVWLPDDLAEAAREHAEQQQSEEGMGHDMSEERGSWREKLTSRAGWRAIADAFFMEWKMAYKEILFGFTVAGFVAVYVPQSFWNALFLEAGANAPSLLAVVENALIAPVIAFFTFIGSMGNVPLAALLWSKNASFGGVMAFLGADLVAATVVYLHAKYYGWRYAGYLSMLLYICMVLAGITVHYIFAGLGVLPTARPTLTEMVRFQIDYTFWLNIVFVLIGGALLWLHFRGPKGTRAVKRRTRAIGREPRPTLQGIRHRVPRITAPACCCSASAARYAFAHAGANRRAMNRSVRLIAALFALFALTVLWTEGLWASTVSACASDVRVTAAAEIAVVDAVSDGDCAGNASMSPVEASRNTQGDRSDAPGCPSMPVAVTGPCVAGACLPVEARAQLAPPQAYALLSVSPENARDLLLASAFFRPPKA